MKQHIFLLAIAGIVLVSCEARLVNNQGNIERLDSIKADTSQQTIGAVKADTNAVYAAFESDTLLHLTNRDTIDCGRIINALFHRSSYKFPVENTYHEEELTAVVESAKDSLLSIKILFIDSAANYRQTVDWLKLNCKTKRLEEVPLYGPDPKPVLINYDARLLDILMRKCAVDN